MVCNASVRSLVSKSVSFGGFRFGLRDHWKRFDQIYLNVRSWSRFSGINHRSGKGIFTRMIVDSTTSKDSSGPVLKMVPGKPSVEDGGYSSGGWKSEDGRLCCGHSSFRGKRATMEDFFDVKVSEINGQKIQLFGIFDGHGGSRAAEYLKANLFDNLVKHPKFMEDTKSAITETYRTTDSNFLASVSMVDSFSCSTLWDDHSSNSHNLGISLNTTTTAANNVPIIKPVPPPSRLDMGTWNPSDHISKDGLFQQTSIGILPPGGMSSQFPSDSTFIEQAARLSCFSSGTFTSMLSPFDTSNPYFTQSRRSDPTILVGHNRSNGEGSPMNSQKDATSSHGVGEHGNTEFSGGGKNGQEEVPLEKTAAKKRKRNTQEMEIGQPVNERPTEMSKENNGVGHKDEPNTSSALGAKNNGKQAKDGGDPPKEDYIHVRARRGQATNSHSLAERVRREKISERMKFLQDLVPGCSKVTGKAVMLDEIINYVQSLQRQVEFLSMKLATVNPQLDFNLEGLVSKDIRAGTSSAIGFSPDLAHQFLNPTSQGGLTQSGVFGIGPPPPDAFRRAINAQLNCLNTFKEAKHQMGISCDDDIQNILSQMGFGNNLPLNIQQESNDKMRCSDSFTM